MALIVNRLLYKENRKRFEQIRAIAADFSTYYVGQNIMLSETGRGGTHTMEKVLLTVKELASILDMG